MPTGHSSTAPVHESTPGRPALPGTDPSATAPAMAVGAALPGGPSTGPLPVQTGESSTRDGLRAVIADRLAKAKSMTSQVRPSRSPTGHRHRSQPNAPARGHPPTRRRGLDPTEQPTARRSAHRATGSAAPVAVALAAGALTGVGPIAEAPTAETPLGRRRSPETEPSLAPFAGPPPAPGGPPPVATPPGLGAAGVVAQGGPVVAGAAVGARRRRRRRGVLGNGDQRHRRRSAEHRPRCSRRCRRGSGDAGARPTPPGRRARPRRSDRPGRAAGPACAGRTSS